VLPLAFAACANGSTDIASCADVIGVEWSESTDGTVSVAATVRSDDIGWDGYADRWEIVAGGEELAVRVLTHPHVDEQPFTRSQSGIVIPPGTVEIEVRAHHSVGGFCGASLRLDGSGSPIEE